MVSITINGRKFSCREGTSVLEAIRSVGIRVPTLCYHEALIPYGACRLCVVEVTKGGSTWLTTSCDLPVREGLCLRTDTPAVLRARRLALELLRAQAPQAEEIRRLAERMGLKESRFAPREGLDRCILCGLCVRVCQKVLGRPAIGFTHRGEQRRIESPFGQAADDCIGCRACEAVCPTGHIRCRDEGPLRRMETFRTDLDLAPCRVCGRPFLPVRLGEFLKKRLPLPDYLDVAETCPDCRRAETARRITQPGGLDAVVGIHGKPGQENRICPER